jgi:sugar-specific transcriptional regulator TrmB/DNA-binding CsgD family transcriptional regulator
MSQVLQSLGVGTDAATVYLLLIAEPGAGPAELAARSGLAEHEFNQAVAQLDRFGLIEPVNPGQAAETVLRLADPELAFSGALRRRDADLARQRQDLAEAGATITAATTAYQASAGHPSRCARPVASQREALGLARQLITGAADECLIAITDLAGTLGQVCEHIAGLASCGARVAIICADAARSSSARASLDILERAGAQVRTLPVVTVPLITGDRPPAALLWPGAPDTSAQAVLVRDPVFARAVAGIFESHWDIATPLQRTPAPDPVTGLTPADQALLVMLASGLGGEAAARRLGTSLTTVRRQIANLKDTLHADSLFQAGCIAARRGWI